MRLPNWARSHSKKQLLPQNEVTGQQPEPPLNPAISPWFAKTTFLAREAAVNRAGTDGDAPLLFAAYRGHLPVVQLLLDLEAAVSQADDERGTPLPIAAHQSHLTVVQLLLDREAAVNQADEEGGTPLLIAAHQGHLPVVGLLLEHGMPGGMRSGARETAVF